METILGQPFKFTFTGTTGQTTFTSIILQEGVLTTYPITYSEVSPSIYVGSFTPLSSGNHSVFIAGQKVAEVQVSTRTSKDILKNIEDEALGSWIWDKKTKILTVFRQDASVLATFTMEDELEEAYRERSS